MTNNKVPIVDVGQSPETSDDSAKLKMQRLKHWAEEQGATFTPVEITEGEHGREIRARVPIKAGALVMHIPKSLLVTTERAKASAIAALLSSSPARISNYGYLAMYLLELKREGCYWKPYLDMLPTDFTEHPNFFSEPELAYMKGCYSLPVIRSRRTRIDAEYEQIRARLPRERMVTREEYAWAMCVVQTRAHSVSFDGKTTVALIPLADLPNHDSHWNMSWQLESKLGFIYSASCNIEAGAPLTIGYGIHCNGHWFSTYGFSIETNPHNLAEIPVPALSPDHPCYAHAKNLGTEREGMRVFQVPVDYDHQSARALFSYLRLGALSDVSCLCADKD